MIIDATNLVLGRMATKVAKAILEGEIVEIANCENAVVSGNKRNILEHYDARIKRGEPFKGPYYPRREDMIVRRTVRGMLPRQQTRGREAYKRLKCYNGMPDHLRESKFDIIKDANISNLKGRYLKIKEISKHIGKKE